MRAPTAPASGGLRNLRCGVPVHLHGFRNALVGEALQVAEPVHDEVRLDRVAPELLVLLEGVDLLHRALDGDASVQDGVRLEQQHVELLDLAFLLPATENAESLGEHFQPSLFTAADGGSPSDEKDTISHVPAPFLAAPP